MGRASLASVAAGSLIVAGCDVKKSCSRRRTRAWSIRARSATPAAAFALKVGAVGPQVATCRRANCGGNSECLWEEIGNLTDEYHNSDFQNTRQDIDQRSIGDDNPSMLRTPA